MFERLLPKKSTTWRHWASVAFLDGYTQTVGSAQLLPSGEAYDVLLRAFTVDKALYELCYELNNRPDWVRIPLIGILANDLQG